jgi:uncharacterized SAM-binding protein YcdF (DUF218 family)
MRRFIRWSLRAFVVWLLIAAGIALAVWIYGRTDRAAPADVIIVLGSGLNADGEAGPAMRRRVERGAALWREGYAPYVLCSGGVGLRQTRSEADACAALMRALGVPDEVIILEDRSRSTEENALFSAIIMDERGFKTALIVSDSYHLLRASWIFAAAGYQFAISRPDADPPLGDHLRALAREIAAVHWYALKTLLNLPVTYVPLV